jgi:hypothetical protein
MLLSFVKYIGVNQMSTTYRSLGSAMEVKSCRIRDSGSPFEVMVSCRSWRVYAVPFPMAYAMCWRQLRCSSMIIPRNLWEGVGLMMVPRRSMGMHLSSFVMVHVKSMRANLLVSNFEM